MSQDKKIQDFRVIEAKLREDLSETFPAGSFDLFIDYLTKKISSSHNAADNEVEFEPKSFRRDEKSNVFLGLNSLSKIDETNGFANVGLGDYAGNGIVKGVLSNFIGYNSGGYLNSEIISREDLRAVSPIIDKYYYFNNGANWLKKYIFDHDYSQSIPGVISSIYLGGYAGLGRGVNRSCFSIHIGTRFSTGNFVWRDYNNIIIGNELSTNHGNSQIFNSIIIGNFLTTWKPNSTDNILAIHNPKESQVNVTDALIFGYFDRRILKINGTLQLDKNRSNAEGDRTFTYEVVAKPDGTLGVKPRVANYIERVDVKHYVEQKEEERFESDGSIPGYSQGTKLIRRKYRLQLDYKIIADKELFNKDEFSIEKISFLHDRDRPIITKENFVTQIQVFDDPNEDSNIWVFVKLIVEDGDLTSYNSTGLRLMKTEFKFGTKSVFDIASFDNSWSAQTKIYEDYDYIDDFMY